MIKINQVPQRTLGASTINGSGSILTLDGIDYDLSIIENGSTVTFLPDDSQIIKIDRAGGDYTCDVLIKFDPMTKDYNPNFADEVLTYV